MTGWFLGGMVFGGSITFAVAVWRGWDKRQPRWAIWAIVLLLLIGAGINLWDVLRPVSHCPAVVYLHGTGTVTIPGCPTVTRPQGGRVSQAL